MKTKQDYWQIDIPKGLTLNEAIVECKKLFPVWTYYDDLDKEVTENDRTSGKAYTVWVKKNIEADEENKDLCVDDLKERGHRGITLLERLVLELNYFKETGKHLDIDNWTLCSGSCDRDGRVPDAGWDDGRFDISWYSTSDRDPAFRSRSCILSLESSALDTSLENRIQSLEQQMEKVITWANKLAPPEL